MSILCSLSYTHPRSLSPFLGSGNLVASHKLPGAHLPAGARLGHQGGLPPLPGPGLQLQRLLPLLRVGVISVLPFPEIIVQFISLESMSKKIQFGHMTILFLFIFYPTNLLEGYGQIK